MQIQWQSESFDARFGELTGRAALSSLVSPSAWLTHNEGGGQTIVNWCDKQERGIIGTALQLGRLRAAQPSDLELRVIGLGLDSHLLTALDRSYPESNVEVRPQGGDRTLLRITWPNNPAQVAQYVIDTARRVALSIEHRQDGKLTSATKYDEFVEAAGTWWPGRVETFDDKGRRIALARLTFAVLSADALAAKSSGNLSAATRCNSSASRCRKKGTVPICAKHPSGRSGKWGLSPFRAAEADRRETRPGHRQGPLRGSTDDGRPFCRHAAMDQGARAPRSG